MNKSQKRLAVFLFILSVGLLLSMCKATKVVIEKKKEIGELSLKVTDLSKKSQDLREKLEGKEKELAQVKLQLEDLNYKLEEEKKKSGSFEAKYNAEKEKGETSLKDLKTAMEKEKSEIREKLSIEIEKLKEEKEILTQDLNEAKLAKEALEAFVAGGKGDGKGDLRGEAEISVTATTGKIIAVYPQGLLAIELEKGSYDTMRPGKIASAQREIKISNVHGHTVILEAAEGEDLSSFRKGDVIKYVR